MQRISAMEVCEKLVDRSVQTQPVRDVFESMVASLPLLVAQPYPTDLAAWSQYQQCVKLAFESLHIYESTLFQKLYNLLPELSKKLLKGNEDKLELLAQHVKEVLEEASKMVLYLCQECGASFSKLSVLKSHSLTHSAHRPYQCTKCSKTFKTSGDLERHRLRIHFEGEPILCDQCGKSFKGPEQFAKHLKTVHKAPKPYVCEVCSEAFVKQCHLKRHVLSHDPNSVMCQFCNVYFRNKNLLNRHHESKHSGTEYACDKCDARLKTKLGLAIHQANHEKKSSISMLEGTLLQCDQCGARFASAISLTYHRRRMHDGIPIKTSRGQRRVYQPKEYKCEQCGRIFNRLHAFKAHVRIHLDEKPYACEVCGNAFRQQSILYRHRLRQHIKVRAFQCEICQKDFAVKGDLVRHLVSHSDNRPFQCDFCTSTFKTQGDLQSHRARHIAPVKHGRARQKRKQDSTVEHSSVESTSGSKKKKQKVAITDISPREILENLAQ